MSAQDRVALLRKVGLFDEFPEERLSRLAAHLEPVTLADGQRLFEEGTPGDGLYIVISGRVRVAKKMHGGGEKDLASLGPGDCLGEMALLDEVPRSASAYGTGACELMKLKRDALKAWLAQDPPGAMDFFSELLHEESTRLRRTSAEMALLYDLSSLLVEAGGTPASLLQKALDRVTPQLEGEWSAASHVYNPYNEEMDAAGTFGKGTWEPESSAVPAKGAPAMTWHDNRTLVLVLQSPTRLLATARFRAAAEPDADVRAETARVLAAVSRLLCSALENLEFRADEALRRRLQTRSNAQGF